MSYRLNVKTCSFLSVLIAIEIVLSRFCSIHTWNLKIGFAFIPVVLAAMLFGAWEASIVAAIGDIVGAFLFPVGAYFPGFTVTALLTGAVFGICLYRKVNVFRIVTSVLLVQVIGSLIVNTYWISVLYGMPYWPTFVTRIYQTAGMTAVQVIVIYVLSRSAVPALRRFV